LASAGGGLAEDLKLPKQERRSALLLFEELQRRGYQGAHDSVRRQVKEWLRRVLAIRGRDHLSQLLHDFEAYHNEYRGHAAPGGAVPQVIHRGEQWSKPETSAKAVPATIERRFLPDTQITAYRLAA
jgi:hypothetical protein